MMNVDNKDTLSLMFLCEMRDSSYYNLLFCAINNIKEYRSSFVLQRRNLARITLPIFALKCCDTAMQCTVPMI